MINIADKKDCSGCAACYNACPIDCIAMIRDGEGFCYPQVKADKCINCHICEKACAFYNRKAPPTNRLSSFLAKTKNLQTRIDSSSGGVFSEISTFVLNNGGVVYGVAISDDCKSVKHIRVESAEKLSLLRGSKYLQTAPGLLYRKVRCDLLEGRMVLFSGTPCQVRGLKNYLGKDYEGLLTVDFVCHGVPSPFVWEGYLSHLEKRFDAKTMVVNFRKKKCQNLKYGVRKNKQIVTCFYSPKSDPFMNLFLKNYSLRPSCYSCTIKSDGYYSDITIADAWGIGEFAAEFEDQFGVSLVVINSLKGSSTLNAIEGNVEKKEVPLAAAVKYNSSYYLASKKPKGRDTFFEELTSKGFGFVRKKYAHVGFFTKFKKMARKYLFCNRSRNKNGNEAKMKYGLFLVFRKNDKNAF